VSDRSLPDPPVTALTALTRRVSRAVAIYETNRGGDEPRAVESSLRTVAGVKASLRTVGQHIVARAVTDLVRHPQLRRLGDPDLTAEELRQADARLRAVLTVLKAVPVAVTAGTGVRQFVTEHDALLATAGLTAADVGRMVAAVGLRSAVVRAHHTIEEELDGLAAGTAAARRKELVAAAAAAVPVADRLGLDEASLRAYIRNPRNWGEHAAGWQRLAVERMPRRVGLRIIQAAEHDGGMPMLEATVRGLVTELAGPGVPDEDVVRAVAAAHNADPAYPGGVWREYRRLYPAQEARPAETVGGAV
jgi:hypothetical protein